MTIELIRDMPDADYRALPAICQSEIKAWLKCPAAWFAEYLAKTWKRESSDAMLLGCLLESKVCNDRDGLARLRDDKRLYTKAGGVRAEFMRADAMAAAWLRQPWMPDGWESQVVLYGTLVVDGIDYRVKARLDLWWEKLGRIADIKTAKGFGDCWLDAVNDNGEPCRVRAPWFREYDYVTQAAWYTILADLTTDQNDVGSGVMAFDLLAVSSEPTPDVRWVRFPSNCNALIDAWASCTAALPQMQRDAEDGPDGLRSCGECEYCRQTKVLTAPEVMP